MLIDFKMSISKFITKFKTKKATTVLSLSQLTHLNAIQVQCHDFFVQFTYQLESAQKPLPHRQINFDFMNT